MAEKWDTALFSSLTVVKYANHLINMTIFKWTSCFLMMNAYSGQQQVRIHIACYFLATLQSEPVLTSDLNEALV